MSRQLSDAGKTARIAAVLAEEYPPPRYAPMWEVAPSTGYASRFCDLLVLHLWPSDGLELHGFEIKASKADLKRELADSEKSQALAKYCDRWTLVTWDTAVVGTLDLPGTWGWWTLGDGGEGIEVQRKPKVLTPESWPERFAASLVRRAIEQSPNAHFTADAVQRAVDKALQQNWRMNQSAIKSAHRDGWYAARGQKPGRYDYDPETKSLAAEWEAEWDRFKAGHWNHETLLGGVA